MASTTLSLQVNGQTTSAPVGFTLADLLVQLGIEMSRIAVEHNRRVVPRAEHAALKLSSGDQIEIVTFVGGGL